MGARGGSTDAAGAAAVERAAAATASQKAWAHAEELMTQQEHSGPQRAITAVAPS